MKSTHIPKSVTVGMTYNHEVGGFTANSIKKIFNQLNQNILEIDYRSFLQIPPEECHDIHTNVPLKIKLFKQAKIKALDYIKQIDALIIPGNSFNVDPRFYGEENQSQPVDITRSIAEMALIHVAMQQGMPLLVICGGHQVASVYFGTKLNSLSEAELKQQPIRHFAPIKFYSDSELAQIFFKQKKEPIINSNYFFGSHSQVINQYSWKKSEFCQQFLNIVALADDDKQNIEAAENKVGAPFYSLQFHPEVGYVGLCGQRGPDPSPELSHHIGRTEEIRNINARIFQTFITAAKTFHNKKIINKNIGVNQTQTEKLEIKQSLFYEKLNDRTHRSLFLEVGETVDIEIDENNSRENLKHNQSP